MRFEEEKAFLCVDANLVSLADEAAGLRPSVHCSVEAEAQNFAVVNSLLGIGAKIASHYL